ncbi:MAG: hypothetical protein ACLPWD_00360 [Methanobacterium sp.]
MRIIKEWEYVIKSLKKIKPPERAVDLAESIQEQLKIYDLNRNTYEWKHGGYQLIVGDLYDLGGVLESGSHYCYSCISYQPHCNVCPINSPSIKECCKELTELTRIVSGLDYKRAKQEGYLIS